MMDFITAPLVVGFICLGIYALFELFVRRKERLLIIEKISERMDIADLGKRLSLPSYCPVSYTHLDVYKRQIEHILDAAGLK